VFAAWVLGDDCPFTSYSSKHGGKELRHESRSASIAWPQQPIPVGVRSIPRHHDHQPANPHSVHLPQPGTAAATIPSATTAGQWLLVQHQGHHPEPRRSPSIRAPAAASVMDFPAAIAAAPAATAAGFARPRNGSTPWVANNQQQLGRLITTASRITWPGGHPEWQAGSASFRPTNRASSATPGQ